MLCNMALITDYTEPESNKANGFLLSFMQLCYAITFLWATAQAVTRTTVQDGLSLTLILLALLALSVILLKQFWPRIKRVHERTIKRALLFGGLVYLAFLLFISWYLATNITTGTWDFPIISRDAYDIATAALSSSQLSYYMRYPNNDLLLFLLSSFYRFIQLVHPGAGLVESHYIAICLNVISIAASIFLVYIVVKDSFGFHAGALAVVMTEFFSPIWLYSSIYYSDIFPITIILLIIYLALHAQRTARKTCMWASYIMMGLLAAVGFKLKATVLFVMLSLMVCMFNKHNKGLNKAAPILVCLAIALITSHSLGSYLQSSFLGISESASQQNAFPYTHWIMMSLNDTGGYNPDDYELTLQAGNQSARKEMNIGEIEKRIEEKGAFGTFEHLFVTKVARTWGDGTLSGSDYISRHPTHKDLAVYNFFSIDGSNYRIYYSMSQAYWLMLLAASTIYGIASIGKEEPPLTLACKGSLLLFFLFELIWECNARYVVHMLALIVILSAAALFLWLSNSPTAPATFSVSRSSRP